jgi:DNA ligase-1
MRLFAALFRQLDEAVADDQRHAALVAYWVAAPAVDARRARWLLRGASLELGISARRLRTWGPDWTGHPAWLIQACYAAVGDLAETLALLVPEPAGAGCDLPLHRVLDEVLLPLRGWDAYFQGRMLRDFQRGLNRDQALLCNKLLCGPLRLRLPPAVLDASLPQAD